jgi:hypothetical protein
LPTAQVPCSADTPVRTQTPASRPRKPQPIDPNRAKLAGFVRGHGFTAAEKVSIRIRVCLQAYRKLPKIDPASAAGADVSTPNPFLRKLFSRTSKPQIRFPPRRAYQAGAALQRCDKGLISIHAPQGCPDTHHPPQISLTPHKPRSMFPVPPEIRPRSVPVEVVVCSSTKEAT